MIRFTLGVFIGLSCAGWVAAHPPAVLAIAVHMIAAGEHVVGEVVLQLVRLAV